MIESNTSFIGLLGVLFIGLKLTGSISWPWVWVTAPLWAPLAIVLVLLASALLCGLHQSVEQAKSHFLILFLKAYQKKPQKSLMVLT